VTAAAKRRTALGVVLAAAFAAGAVVGSLLWELAGPAPFVLLAACWGATCMALVRPITQRILDRWPPEVGEPDGG
jgi:dolichol kinase